ncbi:hypothetical protein DC3_04960 [Deinococcus cellulosilyticus NBRC 106333 = KACC 11606]|uniref:Peptidase S8/S53 domain-containing protein n=2 Tax=Deinococcus cellulosilyticus TaxID=401558 RepID=A0A511MWU9_DEIC1|nr:hypothetical protein DC3_04960 [Deinococcus cellulosilyticus NBRC 106333 = KACC 11606]
MLGLALLVGCNSYVILPPDGQGQATLNLILPSGVTSQSQQTAPIPGEYIVTFQKASDLQKLSGTGVVITQPHNNQALLKASSAEELRNLPGVLRVQPNYRYQKQLTPNDPYLDQPWEPTDPDTHQWYLDQIGAAGAWNDPGTTTQVKVAVLDDGYTHHEDLKGSHLDLQPIGCNQATGERCLNPADKNDDPYYPDESLASHGMSLIGLIGATTNNGKGMASLNFNAGQQAPIQVVPINIYTPSGSSSTDIIARGIRTAIAKGAKVINLSLCMSSGGVCTNTVSDPVLDQALKEARDAGVVVMASAGNNGKSFVAYPANSVNAVSVGATNLNKEKATFSHYGGHLRLVAPGQDLLVFNGRTDDQRSVQTEYMLNSGTSFSAPLAAAAAALLFSKRPTATWDQVVGALIHSGDDLTDPTLKDAKFLRIDKALQEIGGNPPAPPALRGSYQAHVTVSGVKVNSPVVFAFGTNVANVFSSQTLESGAYRVRATIEDRYQPGKTIYSCEGTMVVAPDDSTTTDIQCK